MKFSMQPHNLDIVINLLAVRKKDYSLFGVYANTFPPQAID